MRPEVFVSAPLGAPVNQHNRGYLRHLDANIDKFVDFPAQSPDGARIRELAAG
jgi:hypothetical protein